MLLSLSPRNLASLVPILSTYERASDSVADMLKGGSGRAVSELAYERLGVPLLQCCDLLTFRAGEEKTQAEREL